MTAAAAAAAAENAGQRFRVQCSNRQSSKVYTAHMVLLVLPKLKRLALLARASVRTAAAP
jgi:hypothetical protein